MKNQKKPLVGIIMGSDTDLRVMNGAKELLEQFNVAYEIKVVSAHRTPDLMMSYAGSAQKRGLKIIIAGAGGAAHLPGMVASATTLPVIGVPVNVTPMQGWDALLSILQMPKGVPVATVGIDNAGNAALLAIRILALSSKPLQKKLALFAKSQKEKVSKANKNLTK